MVYSRFQRGNTKKLHGKRIIHGHIPQKLNQIKDNIAKQNCIIGIDNGCILGDKKKGFGRLICLDTDSMKTYSVKNID
jgi:serine/threonine protein phosphatase 1